MSCVVASTKTTREQIAAAEKTILSAWSKAQEEGLIPAGISYHTISAMRKTAGKVKDYEEMKGCIPII